MTEVHQASLRPGRKPIKDWAPDAEEKARIEAMLAKCQKNAEPRNQAAPAPSDAGTNAPTPRGSLPNSLGDPQLCWTRTGSHEMTSACGMYQVRKFIPDGAPHGRSDQWRYECYCKCPGYWYYSISGYLMSFDDAKGRCENHRRGKSLK